MSKSEFYSGLGCIILALLLWFYLIPSAIVVPQSIDNIALSPAFWPRIISIVMLLAGIVACIKNRKVLRLPGLAVTFRIGAGYIKLSVALLIIFGYYFAIDIIGIRLSSIICLFSLITLCSPRHWLSALIIAITIPTLLSLFFTEVANVYLPEGIFYRYQS